ncbi:MAG: glycosyltransferase, partial [Syntrophorhabdaceae bacterium]|nr:glycosyltransferase [Syntrophorhabdaceae bacterium]
IFPYELSGTPLTTYNHASFMKKRGIEVAVIIPSFDIHYGFKKESVNGLTVYKVRGFDKFKSFFFELDNKEISNFLHSIENIIREFKPDIVHINDYVFMPLEIIQTFKKFGCVVVRNVCNLEELCFFDAPIFDKDKNALCSGPESVDKCTGCVLVNVMQKPINDKEDKELAIVSSKLQNRFELIRLIYDRYVDAIIFTTDEFKKYFTDFIPIKNEKIKVIPRGFQLNFKRNTTNIKVEEDIVRFAFVGNAIYRKGIDVLLRAFEEIKDLEGFRLDIYGGVIEDYHRWIKELENRYPGKISYKGPYKPDEISSIADSIHVAIAPSYFETYHRVVREMLYFGIPVIVTDFFGSSIIKDGINGLRIPTGDSKALAHAMKRLINDKGLIERLSMGAINTEIPDLKEEIDGIYNLYLQLVNMDTQKTEIIAIPQHMEFFEPDLKKITSTIIIPVKEKWDYTKVCLDSIVRYTTIPYEIIIVDNGSKEPLFKSLKAWKEKNPKTVIRYLRLNKNKGFAGGCNEGAYLASGDYLVFLNNDTIVTPNWLKSLIKPLAADPSIGITGPLSNYINGRQRIDNCPVSFDNLQRIDFGRLVAYSTELSRKNKDRFMYTEVIMGLCLAIRKELFDTIGGFDERFYPGNFEDSDLSMRIHKMGLKPLICMDAFVYHFGNKTFMHQEGGYSLAYEKNLKAFMEKWHIPHHIDEESMYHKIINEKVSSIEDMVCDASDKIRNIIYRLDKKTLLEIVDFYMKGKIHEKMPLIIVSEPKNVELAQKVLQENYPNGELDNFGDITLFAGETEEITGSIEREKRVFLYTWKDKIEEDVLKSEIFFVI